MRIYIRIGTDVTVYFKTSNVRDRMLLSVNFLGIDNLIRNSVWRNEMTKEFGKTKHQRNIKMQAWFLIKECVKLSKYIIITVNGHKFYKGN